LLTKLAIDAKTAEGRYLVGGATGLYLQVKRGIDGTPRRSWVWRFKFAGRAREMGLGPYPQVSLAEARDKAKRLAGQKRDGLDPLAEKHKLQARAAGTKTFKEASDLFLTHICTMLAGTKFPGRSAENWRSALRNHAFPRLGRLDVRDIEHAHIKAVLVPLSLVREGNKHKGRGGPHVAAKLRARIFRILEWCGSEGWRDPKEENPAAKSKFKDVLGPLPKVRNHAAPALKDAPGLYRRIHAAEGGVYRGVELMIFGATRLRETFDARWDEFDFENALWTIPASRTKVDRPHEIPLSSAALRCLKRLAETRSSEAYLFPGRSGKPLVSSMVGPALLRIGVGFTNHGWRSVFRTACAELGVERQTAELALAHKIGDATEQAYMRSTLIEQRRAVMERYARWLTGAPVTSPVQACANDNAAALAEAAQ
jgi:integrase